MLQSRAVLDIAAPGSTHYDDLRPTCQEDECTATELDAAAEVVLEGDDGNRFLLGPAAWDQDNVLTAEVNKDDAYKGWTVDASLDEQGTAAFSAVTAAALRVAPPGNQVAIVLNGLVVSAPAVMSPITSGRFQLTGLTKAQAEEIAGLE